MYKISDGIEFVGKSLYFLPKCHSTNDIAAELLDKGLVAPGAVIITDHQGSGKGQRGNRWESDPGMNLTFSLVLEPRSLEADKNFYLNIVASLAVTDMLRQIRDSFYIKWPNDIFFRHQKAGGILIENSIISGRVGGTIIGIGLNVNQLAFNGVDQAISLARICSESFDLNDILNRILKCFDHRWGMLESSGLAILKRDYLDRLYGLGEFRRFRVDDRIREGKIEGIDPSGRLIVMFEDGRRSFGFQEIKYLN